MHDLNTINKINAGAFAASIASYRSQGRFVLARYEGTHLVSIETFSEQAPAQVALDSAVSAQHGGERNVLFTPITARLPAEIPQQTTEKTLGDYINRLNKTA